MRLNKKQISFSVILFALVLGSQAQQLPILSQYMMDQYQINPAFAGYDGYMNIHLTAHEQWVGLDNSPKTHAISFHTRLYEQSYIQKENPVKKKWRRAFRGGRIGIGGAVYDDRLGLISRTGFQITYAYHIPFEATQLSFGLSANAFQYRLDLDEIVLFEEEDPYLLGYDGVLFIPDADFGVIFSAQDYHVGLSINQLFQSSWKLGNNGNSKYQILRHYYFTVGYSFNAGQNVQIKPNLLLKSSNDFSNLQADINLTVHYKNAYWGGISYRTKDVMIFMAGLRYNQFHFGYAFDYSFSTLRNYNYGSHEIIAGFRLGDPTRRFRWLK